jgi:PDZ domain-containing secreted protein
MFWSAANEMVNNEKEELTMSEVEDMYADIEQRANMDRVENQEVEILKSLYDILSDQEVSDTIGISKDEQTKPNSALMLLKNEHHQYQLLLVGSNIQNEMMMKINYLTKSLKLQTNYIKCSTKNLL